MLAFAISATLSLIQPVGDLSDELVAWLPEHSPYGFDLTLDGVAWINLAGEGARDDFSVRAEDLHDALASHVRAPVLWVRGYHARNRDVRFRESRTRYILNCDEGTIQRQAALTFDAGGHELDRVGGLEPQYITPGSTAESLKRLFCAEGKQ